MSYSFGIAKFVNYLDVLLSTVFVLAGFMFAAFSLRFQKEVNGDLQDGSIQKAFNHRNESRRLLRRFLIYAGVLLVARLAVSVIEWPDPSTFASSLFLGFSLLAVAPALVLLRETYRFYHASTAMHGKGVL